MMPLPPARPSGADAPPRVALVLPYASYWESAVPFDFRAEREGLLDAAAAEAATAGEVVFRGVVASREDGERAAAGAAAAGAEALLVVQTMATMPAFALAAVRAPDRVPVVVWALHRAERLPAEFDHTLITTEGATVGAPMLTSALVREGRPFELVVRRLGDDATLPELAGALRAAAAAHRLGRARIGRVGPAIDGYEHVDADAERLRRETGIALVPIEPAELRDVFVAVPDARVRELEAAVRASYAIDPTRCVRLWASIMKQIGPSP